ncbi:MAG: hypothetical protein IJ916_06080 [Paludibacteraceae bacterium]|nr:hypothetical protein [Paludibacteraceae bacterium]MBR2261252.1 hypothetical protein [Paludibacteraceae bacterium]MEE3484945.1 hypothetical protein [Bacteroidales bacterium]
MNKLAFLGLSLLLLCNTGCSKTDEEVDPIVDGASVSGNVGNYNYVDLGLSVKWATYNIGASKPSEYGDYFAWGETKTKDSFLENNYKWCKNTHNNITKYCLDSGKGSVDNKSTLDKEDDAASVNWGDSWRMPTLKEQKELIDGCTWEWTSDFNNSGIAGAIATSKKNSNTIFFPAAGYSMDLFFVATKSSGLYWSSTLDENSIMADIFGFRSECTELNNYAESREYGLTIRAVTK